MSKITVISSEIAWFAVRLWQSVSVVAQDVALLQGVLE